MADMICTVLVEQKMRYEERIEQLINERNNQEDFIKSLLKTIVEKGDIIENLRKDLDGMGREVDLEKYKNKILTEVFDAQYVIITNLRKDLDGMSCEVKRLRELNNNQAKIIANNRTKRSDFNV